MYSYNAYLLRCNNKSQEECFQKKLFSCSGKHTEVVQKIKRTSILFLYNISSKTLIGPFTAANDGVADLEPGTWTTTMDLHSISSNIGLEWEELHELKNASDGFPFLKNPETCKLTQIQTQGLLDRLKLAPIFNQ